MSNARTIALTGNIGAGKSTVLKAFADIGAITLSTDDIAHQLLAVDPGVREKVKDQFGEEVFNDDGEVDRAKLAGVVFGDNALRKKLEDIIHPEIEKVIENEITKLPEGSTFVVEAPLLFEAGWAAKFDYSILVQCPLEERRKRYCQAKGITEEDFNRRDANQMKEKEKARLSMFVIDNSGPPEKLSAHLGYILEKIKNN